MCNDDNRMTFGESRGEIKKQYPENRSVMILLCVRMFHLELVTSEIEIASEEIFK